MAIGKNTLFYKVFSLEEKQPDNIDSVVFIVISRLLQFTSSLLRKCGCGKGERKADLL